MKYIFVVVLLSISCVAQAPSQAGGLPAGTIDGSKNPQLIPDDIAWSVFISSTSLMSKTSPKRYAARMEKLRGLGIPSSDLTTLDSKLTEFHSLNGPILSQLTNSSLSAADRTFQIQQRKELVVNYRGQIEISLSPEGLKSLRAYIQTMKSKIKLYPIPTAAQ